MIRLATPNDVATILRLIRELAEYENLSSMCVATEENLRRHLFGPEPAAEAAMIECDGAPVGYAIWFKTFSTFLAAPGIYLEDVYVQPASRRRGLGNEALQYLARLCVDRGYGRLEWSVLNWNAPSIAFYESRGAVPLSEWTMMRLTGDALGKLASR
jgi:GNAT superfamily N-acetyltransferase